LLSIPLFVIFSLIISNIFEQLNIDIEQLGKDSYVMCWVMIFLICILLLFCLFLVNLIFSPIYFLGYFLRCISFDEAMALTKNPAAFAGYYYLPKSLLGTLFVDTTTPQFTLKQNEPGIPQKPDEDI